MMTRDEEVQVESRNLQKIRLIFTWSIPRSFIAGWRISVSGPEIENPQVK
jgi:hypothetical protein